MSIVAELALFVLASVVAVVVVVFVMLVVLIVGAAESCLFQSCKIC